MKLIFDTKTNTYSTFNGVHVGSIIAGRTKELSAEEAQAILAE